MDKLRQVLTPVLFSSAIIEGALKISEEIQTFRAAGYQFYTEREIREFSKPKKEKIRVQDVLEEVLQARKRAAGLQHEPD